MNNIREKIIGGIKKQKNKKKKERNKKQNQMRKGTNLIGNRKKNEVKIHISKKYKINKNLNYWRGS